MRNCSQESFFQGNNVGVCYRIFYPLFHKTIVPFFSSLSPSFRVFFLFFLFLFVFFLYTFIFPVLSIEFYMRSCELGGAQSHVSIFVFILPLMANKGAASRFNERNLVLLFTTLAALFISVGEAR